MLELFRAGMLKAFGGALPDVIEHYLPGPETRIKIAKASYRKLAQRISSQALAADTGRLLEDSKLRDIAKLTIDPLPTSIDEDGEPLQETYKRLWKDLVALKTAEPERDIEMPAHITRRATVDTYLESALSRDPFAWPELPVKALAENAAKFLTEVEPYLHARELNEPKRGALRFDVTSFADTLRSEPPETDAARNYDARVKAAKERLRQILSDEHETRRQDLLILFELTTGAEITTRHRTEQFAPTEMTKLLKKHLFVPFGDWPDSYINSRQHFQSQMLNGVDLVINDSAEVGFHVAGPKDGGLQPFQKHWFSVSQSSAKGLWPRIKFKSRARLIQVRSRLWQTFGTGGLDHG